MEAGMPLKRNKPNQISMFLMLPNHNKNTAPHHNQNKTKQNTPHLKNEHLTTQYKHHVYKSVIFGNLNFT